MSGDLVAVGVGTAFGARTGAGPDSRAAARSDTGHAGRLPEERSAGVASRPGSAVADPLLALAAGAGLIGGWCVFHRRRGGSQS
ncbi:hypothetical protein AQ490_20235 [Wenjunlia vitaminophila]|uniref:Uncharacterized protein n=1 Tax=Wenjunlia vitaminophila TaxID=76728 RepID=A0A0T6LU43_WENVI|nr:hypothetical protein [Wenjunlia vitaminophila]KRV49645.1 hypothetical protein AQ490_20235 [Wenjunlia vitaminophila]